MIYALRGCFVYVKMTHLDKEELSWLKPAKVYPRISFASNHGNRSTLEVFSKELQNNANLFHAIWSQSDVYEAHGGYTYYISDKKNDIKGYFGIRKSVENDSVYVQSSIDNYHGLDNILLTPKRLSIGKIVLDDCVYFNNSNSYYTKNSATNRKIAEVIYSRRYGLVYYKYYDGEYFTRNFIYSE